MQLIENHPFIWKISWFLILFFSYDIAYYVYEVFGMSFALISRILLRYANLFFMPVCVICAGSWTHAECPPVENCLLRSSCSSEKKDALTSLAPHPGWFPGWNHTTGWYPGCNHTTVWFPFCMTGLKQHIYLSIRRNCKKPFM